MMKRIARFTGSVVAAGALAGCFSSFGDPGKYRVSARVHHVIPASTLQRAVVANVSGKIDVRGWNRQDVDVNALVRATDNDALHKIAVSVERTDGEIHIRTQYPHSFLGFGARGSGSVDYEIRVPQRLAVTAKNVSGDVTISGVGSDVDVSSVSGDVNVNDMEGNVDLKTTSGSIEESVRALKGSNHLKAASVSGDISLRIPKNTGANVSAHSISGGFSSNLGLPKADQTVGTNVGGQINGGGATISFSTVSGSMTLTGH